jgi:hypothetical protein
VLFYLENTYKNTSELEKIFDFELISSLGAFFAFLEEP